MKAASIAIGITASEITVVGFLVLLSGISVEEIKVADSSGKLTILDANL